jgi:ADP-heptose:LPS heptosyltransferase
MVMRRVLIIRVCAIGDFILNLPALTSFHNLNPDVQFTLVGNEASLVLAREFIPVENVYSIELPPWSRLFYEALPDLEFDEAIVWMKDPTVAANLRLSGIPNVRRADPFPRYGHAAEHLSRTLKLERPELQTYGCLSRRLSSFIRAAGAPRKSGRISRGWLSAFPMPSYSGKAPAPLIS